jgi:hypothetical protein
MFYDSIRKFGHKRRFHQAQWRGNRAFHEILPLLQMRANHPDVVQLIRNQNVSLSSCRRIGADGKRWMQTAP